MVTDLEIGHERARLHEDLANHYGELLCTIYRVINACCYGYSAY